MLTATASFWIGIAAAIIALTLSAVATSLSELTPGILRKLEETDSALSEKFKKWLTKKEEYRISIRLLQLISTLLVIYCAVCFGARSQNSSGALEMVIGAMIVLAAGHLIISEGLGYDLSRIGNRYFLRFYMPMVDAARIITWPACFPIVRWRRLISERQEKNNNSEEKATAEDEIISLVEQDEELGESSGELEEDERRMIKGVFDLDETLVREIMTPRVDINAMPQESSVQEVKMAIADSGHTRVPIYQDTIDHIVGVITAKELMNEENLKEVNSIKDLASSPTYIPETKNIGDLLEEFQQDRTQFAVVVDEYGGTGGIVTLEDILEEIVGEIHDDYELAEDEATVRYMPDGTVVVNARTPIQELNEELDLDVPHGEEFETLGGYVSYVLGRIPEKGEILRTDYFDLEIIAADQRRIQKAKLRRKNDSQHSTEEIDE